MHPELSHFLPWRRATAALAALTLASVVLPVAGQGAAAPVPAACADFDAHVNAAWRERTELPPDRARIGSFDGVMLRNVRVLGQAMAALLADPALRSSPGLALLADYVASGRDAATVEAQGLDAVKPWLARIDAVDRAGLPALLGALARLRVDVPLAPRVAPDLLDPTRHRLSFGQSGLGLPDRDDYLNDDAESQRLRAAYRRYAARLLQATGEPSAESDVDALLAFEAELARGSSTRVQRRDPRRNHHPQTLDSLRELAPGVDWAAWLQGFTGPDIAPADVPLVLGQPDFARALARLAAEAPLPQWRRYLRVRLLDQVADHLPRALAEAHFDYREGAIRGLQEPPPRSEQLVRLIGGRYGEQPMALTLGELFVQQAFPPEAQRRAQALVDDIRAAMRERIDALPWMTEPTKTAARAKLDAMVAKIGAPAAWPRWDGLRLDPGSFAGNRLRVAEWATAEDLRRLPQPVDRTRWTTSPHIVNAFAGGGNQIIFPAGILQPPFFDPQGDDAGNYGGIGMVIGHEITHHFDDRGRQFDARGAMRDWWTPEDAAAYRQRAGRVVALYGGFEPLPGQRINGQLTLGENISDLGGIQIAFAAYQRALARERVAGREPVSRDGLTPEQRFFTANAVIWRSKQRPEALSNQLRTDGHSPGRFRVLGPLAQMPAFAQAFDCKAGDAMVAADPIVVW